MPTLQADGCLFAGWAAYYPAARSCSNRRMASSISMPVRAHHPAASCATVPRRHLSRKTHTHHTDTAPGTSLFSVLSRRFSEAQAANHLNPYTALPVVVRSIPYSAGARAANMLEHKLSSKTMGSSCQPTAAYPFADKAKTNKRR